MQTKEILVVDDAAFMRRLIRRTLAQGGFTEIVEAENGVQAVELYPLHRGALVLLDVTMPEMGGLDALKTIRAIDPEARVVMCSAVGQEHTIMEAIRAGALDFIVKPFQAQKLLEVVEGAIGEGEEL